VLSNISQKKTNPIGKPSEFQNRPGEPDHTSKTPENYQKGRLPKKLTPQRGKKECLLRMRGIEPRSGRLCVVKQEFLKIESDPC
jgi:hypothetical protein